jgi:Skp family chaperone for outer membrane proteins
MTINKLLIAAALAAPAMIAVAAPAQAQVSGIATADPVDAVGRTKAFAAANQSIKTTFADNLTKLQAKQTERQKALAQLDKNGDKQVDDSEIAAAQAAKNPAWTQAQALETEINQLSAPPVIAQAYAIEKILERYQEAQKSVIAAKKINVILTPESFVYAPESTDVTAAIATAIDGLAPTVPITAPANWRPARETLAVQERLQQMTQYAMAMAAQQRQGAAGAPPAGPAPAGAKPAATTAPKPVTR